MFRVLLDIGGPGGRYAAQGPTRQVGQGEVIFQGLRSAVLDPIPDMCGPKIVVFPWATKPDLTSDQFLILHVLKFFNLGTDRG